jgi:hypothetical protein
MNINISEEILQETTKGVQHANQVLEIVIAFLFVVLDIDLKNIRILSGECFQCIEVWVNKKWKPIHIQRWVMNKRNYSLNLECEWSWYE